MDTVGKNKDLSIYFIMELSITRETGSDIEYDRGLRFSIVTRCYLFYRICSAFWLVPWPSLPSCETDFIKELDAYRRLLGLLLMI